MTLRPTRDQHTGHAPRERRSRRLIVLGSTGSIGVNTLEVVAHLRATSEFQFDVVGLAAGSNVQLLSQQAKRFRVDHIATANGDEETLPKGVKVFRGSDAALQLVQNVAQPGDLVVGAMVGSAGIPATLAAIERGCDIALANKETLVAAGEFVMPRVRAKGVNLLPIDSEHSAIFQCLEANAETSKRQNVKTQEDGTAANFDVSTFRRFDVSAVRRIVITASGGPFRTWPRERIEHASVEDALNHPTWNMGPKVTIDSASMMNKALEIIEAHWLFDLPAEKIDVIVHPQSLIHSFVEFVDGSVLSQLGPPDMRTPIQYALTWPNRAPGIARTMDWAGLRKMDFEPVDHERFPAPSLAYQVIRTGGTSGAVFNAANEAAVAAFLDRKIAFPRITQLVREALSAISVSPVTSLEDVMLADQAAREFVASRLAASSTRPRPATVAAAEL